LSGRDVGARSTIRARAPGEATLALLSMSDGLLNPFYVCGFMPKQSTVVLLV
jgi:hypothetical protein